MIGQRVRDKISDDTGTVKDFFHNQAIVCWDAPDEQGNYVSSVPAADLESLDTEKSRGAVAKQTTTALDEPLARSYYVKPTALADTREEGKP